MINTIFYFPSSLTFQDYTTMLNNGEIAERTVVFADAQKAIYKGGKKYGGLSDQEFHDLIDSLEHDSWISDEISSVKGDIQSVNTRINSVNSSVADVNNRLTSAISSRDSDITSKVENLFKDSQWLQQNFPQGQTSWDSDWNSELESYLTQVGYWDIDSTTGQKTAKWSKLQNDVDSISLEIANLTGNETSSQSLTTAIESMIEDDIAALNLNTTYASISDVNNAKNILEWLYSGLKSSAGQDKTFTELSSMTKSAFTSAISDIRTQVDKVANGDFVAQTEVSAKVGNAISTMLAQASGDNALATLAAKADTNSDNIAALVLGMTGSTSTANLSTSVSTALGNLTSGLASTSDITSAKSEIYSAISAKDSSDNFISLAALKTQSDADHAQVSLLATNKADASGVVAKSELGTAVASLFASTGDAQNPTAKANVVAVVRDNKSALNLSAQDVNINGYLNGGSATFKGDIQASSFVTGESNEVGIAVMAGEFDDSIANTHKVYFAYDSAQGAATMWFYQNNEWKRINLADSAVINNAETFIAKTFYSLPSENIYYLPPLSSLTTTTLYYSRVTGKYYNTQDTLDPVTSGTYYQINYTPISQANRDAHRGSVEMLIPEVYQNHTSLSTKTNTSRIAAGWPAGNVVKYTISNGEATTSTNYIPIAEVPYTYYETEKYTIVRVTFYRSMQQQYENQQCPRATYIHDLSGDVYTYNSSYSNTWDYDSENITLATALSDNYDGPTLSDAGWFKSNYNSNYVTKVEQDTMMYPDTAGYPNPTWS